jgi:hypothetical protein
VLSDFIVENRGIVPKTLKSASDNIEQVNQIIKTSYPACTQPDPAGARFLPLLPESFDATPSCLLCLPEPAAAAVLQAATCALSSTSHWR